MVCDVFTMNGWDAVYLGASIPVSEIVPLVEIEKPEVLALSITIAPDLPRPPPDRAIRGNPGCVATRSSSADTRSRPAGLWRRIGADAFARDAASAMTWANLRLRSIGVTS